MAGEKTEEYIPIGQNWFINSMKRLGYEPDDRGMCHGMAIMGATAFICGELEEFASRLHTIYRFSKRQTQQVNLKNSTDIFSFFDGLLLHQSPAQFPYLFSDRYPTQKSHPSFELVCPTVLEDKDNRAFINHKSSLSGVYSKKDLVSYLNCIESLSQSQQSSIALLLTSSNHTISVCYNKEERCWYLIDANQLPYQQFKNDPYLLAEKIMRAFNSNKSEYTVLLTEELQTKNQPNSLLQLVNQTPIFQKIHEVTSFKASQYDALGGSWLYMAAAQGHAAVITALIQVGADLNLANKNGATPAFIAAQNGHVEVIKALHEAGADLNQALNDGATPAYIAAENGHAEVINALHEAGADLNQAKENGATPAYIAAQNGHVEVINALHEAGADLNLAKENGATPAFIAAQMGHLDVIKALAQAGADLNLALNDGATPAFIAAQNGHVDVINALHEAGADLNQARNDGATPAFIAAQKGHVDVTAALAAANKALSQTFNISSKPTFFGIINTNTLTGARNFEVTELNELKK